MPISFGLVPGNLRVPGVYVEFDNSQAIQGLVPIPRRILVIGQRLAAGTKAAHELLRVSSVSQAMEYFGQGSMLHHLFEALKRNNGFTESWAIALDDNGAGQAAAGSITFTGPATAAGTLNLYLGGRRVQAAVASGDAAGTIATAVAAAIQADANLAVSAVVNVGDPTQVDLTAKHKGESGDDLDVRLNYQQGEETPAGVGATIVAMNGGTANPVLTTLIATLGDEWFQTIVLPYTDATSLAAIEAELNDRWGPERPIDGRAFAGARGSLSTLTTLGDSRNSPHVCIMGAPELNPTPPWEWAAAVAGIVAGSASIDPARPFQTLELEGVLNPVSSPFTLSERNQLLTDGISTFTANTAGIVRIERLITTYQENAFGAPDTSYLDVNTMETLSFLRFSFRTRFQLKFPRHKLASDGTHFGPGQAVVTPKVAKGETIALFKEWERAGLVEGVDQFVKDLVVERNESDPNRLDLLLPPDLVNQLRQVGAQIAFRL